MGTIADDFAAHVAESLADKAMQELKYLCCYKCYVDDFEEEKTGLSARRDTVRKDIEEAKDRNENKIEKEVELWLDRANSLIQEDTMGKKKWFGLIPNCFWQYKRGKELEEKTKRIKELIEKSNFPHVARSTGLPGIGFYASANFMHLDDRKLTSEKLKEALKDNNQFMIGLYGLGGTGKTTMALQVGKEVEESKVFDKVIFSVVSKDPNLRSIRDNIAKHLNFPLDDKMNESAQAQQLWKRIAESGEKILIILDDLWKELTLREIGIPLGRHVKGYCAILLTTRDRKVCIDMGCHETIELEVLNEKDAADLFLYYAGHNTDDSSNSYKGVALDIVKECGRLPVAIVAVARALKSRPLKEWKQGLERLQNTKSIHDVNDDLKEAYYSLRLSYDYLENEKAKKLFLLCSLFPEDYEIPVELLTRIAIGLGLCGKSSSYSTARSYFTPIKNVLIDSCLLLKAKNDYVKMHDLVREVALLIGNKQVQVVKDSSTMLMDNIQYSSCNIIDFPNRFNGRKLKVLLLWISNDAYPLTVNVPNGIFEGMENLKFLAFMSKSKIRMSAASLFQSHVSLMNVRTLSIKRFELGDISILANLKSLESLELSECSMIDLPNEIRELENLRLLEIIECDILRNNPFEVIGRCSQLKELYYVSSRHRVEETDRSLAQITTLPKLERYHIKGWLSYGEEVDYSISRCFDSIGLRVNFSDEIFQSLVARAKVVKLGRDYYNRGLTNIVPDILPMKDESMEDHLTTLRLESMDGLKCLIDTKSLRSGVAIFSKLVELQLSRMDVRKLCCGPYPVNFLKHLEKLHLSKCQQMEGSLFDGKLELCNLRSIYVSECSMTCLFDPFTSQSLKRLQTLEIEDCFEMKYIVAELREDHDPNQKSHDTLFPKLEDLQVRTCPKLEFILPICFCEDLPLLEKMKVGACEKLEYIFGRYKEERDLHQMGKEAILLSLEQLEISEVPKFINIYAECYLPQPCSDKVQKSCPSTKVEDCNNSNLSRGRLCCFWPKSNASTIHHPSASTNHNNQALKLKYVMDRAHGLFTPPLYPYTHLRILEIYGLCGLKSLFTLSIASSLKLLETLVVGYCDTLEHIVIIDKEDGHDSTNVKSIFPNLQEVYVIFCSHLEYIFSALYSKDLKDLGSMDILIAERIYNVQALSFQNLSKLVIIGCKKLKFILCASTSRRLQKLRELYVLECDKLVSIIKDEDDDKNPMNSNQACFPELRIIEVRDCTSMKYLFPVLDGTLPRLLYVNVEDVPQLGEVFRWKHREGRKLAMEDVFPKLFGMRLVNLPTLHTICKGVDFQTVKLRRVHQCPAISLTSANDSNEELEELFMKSLCGTNSVDDDDDVFYEIGILDRLWREIQGVSEVILEEYPTTNTNLPNLTESTKTSTREIVQEKLSSTPSSDSDMNFKTAFGEDPFLEKYDKEFCVKEPMGDQHALEEPTNQCSFKETSNETAIIRISPPIEEEGPQQDIENDSAMSQPNNGLPHFENSEGVSKEIVEEDPTTNTNLSNLTESTKISIHEIVEEKLSSTPSSDSDMNLKEVFGKGPSSEKYGKESSSKELCGKESMVDDQQALGERRSSNNEAPQKFEEPNNEFSSKETSNKTALTIPPSITTGMTSPQISSIPSLKKRQIETSSTQVEMESESSFSTDQSAQDKTMNQERTSTEKKIKFDQGNHQQFAEDDLMRLFKIMEEDADDMEVHMPYGSKIAAFEDDIELSKALADLGTSLKMSLSEIACSEESKLRLDNALNILSSHCSKDGAPSHGLQATIHSLQQEIQTVLSSSKQACATIDTFNKLEQKEKLIIGERSKRKEAAISLLSKIHNKESSLAEAQLKEAELKEKIFMLQDDLYRKEKEIQECELELLSLKEQKKKSVSDTMGFIKEYEAVKNERCHMGEENIKAKKQLQNMDVKWSSCLSDLKKTTLLLGVHLQQKH